MSDFLLYNNNIMKTKTTQNKTIEYYKDRTLKLEHEVAELDAKLKWYEEQFRLLQKQKYGASSEKTNDDQLSFSLFNEAEDTADLNVEEPELDTITYKRKKVHRTRKELMKNLPTETKEYTLTPEEQVCSSCICVPSM